MNKKTINGEEHVLLRHTPRDRQRVILYEPMFVEAKANVLPEIFNPEYLKVENFEGVDYWQNENVPMAINVTPAINDINTPSQQIAGNNVAIDNVLGVLFDEDALMVDYQLESALSTNVEARKRYRNIWYTFAKNSICDFTEKGILYYLG